MNKLFKIEQVADADISQCAEIMVNEYNNNDLAEGWSKQTAILLCQHYQKLQPDLFLVAKNDSEVLGFTFSLIKPWAEGNCHLLEEICVKSNYRKNGIANNLLKRSIGTALDKYDVKYIKAETYGANDEMPFLWYKRLGFSKEQATYLIVGDPQKVIKSFKN